MHEFIISSLDELPALAEQLLRLAGDRKVWLFSGEIGAGKTTLIKAICDQLGVTETVSSPTFSLVNEYRYQEASTQRAAAIYHLDLYRLKSLEEALDIGIEDYLYSGDFCWIEWPALILPILPQEVAQIKIEIFENSFRKVIFL